MLRTGALVKAGLDPFPVSDDFALLVRQAPIIQLLMTANSLGITVGVSEIDRGYAKNVHV
jgi:hypothetical protein